jgi:hypothetical protein
VLADERLTCHRRTATDRLFVLFWEGVLRSGAVESTRPRSGAVRQSASVFHPYRRSPIECLSEFLGDEREPVDSAIICGLFLMRCKLSRHDTQTNFRPCWKVG